MGQPKILYGKREAANLLSVSIRTLENLISKQQILVCRVGRRVLVSDEAISAFVSKISSPSEGAL